MKKTIVMILIFAAILGAGIWEHSYIEKTFGEFNEKMEEIDNLIQNNETEQALEKTHDMAVWWDDKLKIVEIVSYSQDINLISVTIGEMEGSLMCGDLMNAQSKSTSIIALIDYIEGVLDFNLKDIF